MWSLGKKPPVSQHLPPSYSALCRQHGPAVALCPVVNLSAVLIALSPQLCVTPSDSVSNATFHYRDTGQPVVERKMDFRVEDLFNV